MRRFVGSSLLGVLIAVILPAGASAAIRTFPAPVNVTGITAGPDAALWFTVWGSNKIGRITTAGSVRLFPLPAGSSVSDPIVPGNITAGPDGALWFTEAGAAKVGRITTSGSLTEFSAPSGAGGGITAGPDGALWFTRGGELGRMTTSGSLSDLPGGASGGITAGPDGALWFTQGIINKIGRITTAGSLTEFSLPPTSQPPPGQWGVQGIAAGPDGAFWFTDPTANSIGRVTTGGSVTEFPIPTPSSHPFAITAGPDGALWFTEVGKIGRVTTAGTVSEFSIPTLLGGPKEITAGPDGALWFTGSGGYIGRIDPNTGSRAQPFVGLKLLSKTLLVHGNGKVRLALSCPVAAAGSCTGKVGLKTTRRVTLSTAARRKGGHRRKVLKLGSARFSIPTGHTGKATIKLSKAALRLLAKRQSLRARAVVIAHDSRGTRRRSSATVTLKAPRKGKKR